MNEQISGVLIYSCPGPLCHVQFGCQSISRRNRLSDRNHNLGEKLILLKSSLLLLRMIVLFAVSLLFVSLLGVSRVRLNTSTHSETSHTVAHQEPWPLSGFAQNATTCCIPERIRIMPDSSTRAETVPTRNSQKTQRCTVTSL